MPNTKFNYLYRDAGNYKNYGSVIFSNADNIGITLAELEVLIRSQLFDQTWFYNHQWQVRDLHFGTWDNELDHTWLEFESVEQTDDAADTNSTLAGFIAVIKDLRSSY